MTEDWLARALWGFLLHTQVAIFLFSILVASVSWIGTSTAQNCLFSCWSKPVNYFQYERLRVYRASNERAYGTDDSKSYTWKQASMGFHLQLLRCRDVVLRHLSTRHPLRQLIQSLVWPLATHGTYSFSSSRKLYSQTLLSHHAPLGDGLPKFVGRQFARLFRSSSLKPASASLLSCLLPSARFPRRKIWMY